MSVDWREQAAARHRSPSQLREKLRRVAWMMVEATLFRFSPRPCYAWRRWLLRGFGAQVGDDVRVRSTVRIEAPWRLTIGPNTAVGDYAILYCVGRVTLGARVTVSQYAHLCAGSHDYRQPDMPLVAGPITVEDDAWLAAEVFVGPGVHVGAGAIVGARSAVFSDLPTGMICHGHPARAVKPREGWPPSN